MKRVKKALNSKVCVNTFNNDTSDENKVCNWKTNEFESEYENSKCRVIENRNNNEEDVKLNANEAQFDSDDESVVSVEITPKLDVKVEIIDLDSSYETRDTNANISFENLKTNAPRVLQEQSGLNCHLQEVHKKEISFKCEECTKSFNLEANFRKHMLKVHIKPKIHSCAKCDKRFARNEDLTVHKRSK
ncbi:zinc finger protein 91-like protein [Leptotrombidium deliense]|uniref:Zinc finger protein 91-like protein n=1 Tax=Leptotrombidium deliense TaxID=299467 RepID=A0A443RYH7_9ACAR|nr:zinc finger protein 91-like protein [Leptotrombidium deliense]